MRIRGLLMGAVASSCLLTSAAYAQTGASNAPAADDTQTAADDSPSEIVVTAQRRSERLQDVPMSVTALGGAAFERSPITNLVDVQQSVPNLNISPRIGSGVIAIRGIGFGIITAGAEGSVALHSDGVYQSRPFAALSGLFDIDRIEVARGPQGTLYGRNATGGAINIISNKPTATTEGYVDLSYGNYNALAVEGAISGPIAGEMLTARIAAKIEERDGYGTNLTNNSDIDDLKSRAIRGLLEFKPSETASFILAGDFFKRDDASGASHYVRCLAVVCSPFAAGARGAPIPSNPRDVYADVDTINRVEDYGFSLTGKVELPFADLTSVSGYRKGSLFYYFDLDGTAQPGSRNTREENYSTFSQEIQLSNSSDAVDWLVGAYYFREKNFARANGLFPPFLPPTFSQYFQGGRVKTNAYAAFGELSYHVSTPLTVTLGARYSKERKHIFNEYTYLAGPNGPVTGRPGLTTVPCNPAPRCVTFPDKVSFDAFTPKFSARYQFSRDQQIYVTVQKGFKSGGFTIGAVNPAFNPETIWSYEAGLKASWFDRVLTTNISVYHYDYKNLQLGRVGATGSVVTNAAQSKIDGVELEWRLRVGDHIRLDGFGTYNHARFSDFISNNPGDPTQLPDQSGNLLPNAPKWTGKLGAEYFGDAFGGTVTVRGELFASSRVYFTEYNNLRNSQKAYELVNLNVRYDGANGWYGALYANNLFDRTVAGSGIVTGATTGSVVFYQYLPPRTYGIRVGKKF